MAMTAQAALVHYTFNETASGNWKVYVQVTPQNSDTVGLSAYSLYVNADPALVSYAENVLGTTGAGFEPIGFQSTTLMQGDVGGQFNAGNFQPVAPGSIPGIGIDPVDEPGIIPGTTPHVVLGVPALLGVLTTPAGLGYAGELYVTSASGLLDSSGEGFMVGADLPTIGNGKLTYEVNPDYTAPGDANGDGQVTDADYTIWADTYGSTTDFRADWNDDVAVTDADYTIWADNYGLGVPSVAVPEPVSLALLGLGGLTLLRRRR